LDPNILQAYRELTCIPNAVIKSTHVPTTHNEAVQFIQTYIGHDRVGPANTHNLDPDTICDQAVAGYDAEVPDIHAHDKPPTQPGM